MYRFVTDKLWPGEIFKREIWGALGYF